MNVLVAEVVARLGAALEPDEVVLGGGNVEKLKTLPPKCRAGDNRNAFQGGFRLWEASGPASIGRTEPPSYSSKGKDKGKDNGNGNSTSRNNLQTTAEETSGLEGPRGPL